MERKIDKVENIGCSWQCKARLLRNNLQRGRGYTNPQRAKKFEVLIQKLRFNVQAQAIREFNTDTQCLLIY